MNLRRGTGGEAMAEALPGKTLSKLIGSIYDCALDASRWEQTLADIRDALSCQVAQLALVDLRQNRYLISRTVGMEPCWLEQQANHVPEINAGLTEAFASGLSLDEPHVISRHIPRGYRETSPYYQDCLKPQGLVDIMTYFLMQTPARFAGFGVARHERHGVISEREIELGGLLLPHLRRAITISDVLDVRTIEHARMAETLGALRCAVMLTDARGAILYANPRPSMLRNGGPIRAGRGPAGEDRCSGRRIAQCHQVARRTARHRQDWACHPAHRARRARVPP